MKSLRTAGLPVLVAAILCPCAGAMASNGSHAPITITSDADFQACNCVVGGSGTTTDPYIIGPWTINSAPSDSTAVFVDGTSLTKSFTLFNLTMAGNAIAQAQGLR